MKHHQDFPHQVAWYLHLHQLVAFKLMVYHQTSSLAQLHRFLFILLNQPLPNLHLDPKTTKYLAMDFVLIDHQYYQLISLLQELP